MIYIVIGLIALILLLRWLSPKRYAVHASRIEPLPEGVRAEGKWLLGGFVYDENGNHVDVAEKFIGHAAGSSMTAYGIPSGATFIGDFLKDADKASLVHGDIVVVIEDVKVSETGLCLRVVDEVTSNCEVSFLPDSYGKHQQAQKLDAVLARVTYVIDNQRVANNEWVASILRSVRNFPSKLLKRAA